MAKIEFIFLARDWVTDKISLVKQLTSYNQTELPYWLLLFPEGTTYCDNTYQKSKKFHETSNYATKHPINVLLPRHTGLHACLQTLEPSLTAIYDMTIFYSGTRPASATDGGISNEEHFNIPSILWQHQGPKDVHIFLSRIAKEDIPKEKHEFEIWLNERWIAKDKILEEMYRMQTAQKSLDSSKSEFDAQKAFNKVTYATPELVKGSSLKEKNLELSRADRIFVVGFIWIVWSMVFLPTVFLWIWWKCTIGLFL